jgi:hypothetical protein
MKLSELLEQFAAKIIDEGLAMAGRSRMTHYAALGAKRTPSLLEKLHAVAVQSFKTRKIAKNIEISEGIGSRALPLGLRPVRGPDRLPGQSALMSSSDARGALNDSKGEIR